MPRNQSNIYKTILLAVFIVTFFLLILITGLRKAATKLANNFFYPFLNVPTAVEGSLTDKSLLLESRLRLGAELERLRRENDLLTAELAVSKDLLRENERLRRLLGLAAKTSFNFIFAEIILRDPSRWDECFTINKGSIDGLSIGAVVLSYTTAGEGNRPGLAVVGRITAVTRHTAVVSTVLSEECRLSVYLPASKASGTISGGAVFKHRLYAKLTYLPLNCEYDVGESVYTSGLSGWTPASLFIGRLAAKLPPADKGKDRLYGDGIVESALDFEHLRFLMVVQKENPGE